MPRGKAKLTDAQKAELKKKRDEVKAQVLALDPDMQALALETLLKQTAGSEGYQRKKTVETIYKNCDSGIRTALMDMLIDHWATQLPKKARQFKGVDNSLKLSEKIKWLEEHWGTTTSSGGVRKMPTEQVIELLLTFVLNTKGAGEDGAMTFGSLEDGSELAEKVASSLEVMNDSVGEEVVITRSAFNELQRLRRLVVATMDESELRNVDTRLRGSIDAILTAVPGAKTEEEIAKLEADREKREAAKAKN